MSILVDKVALLERVEKATGPDRELDEAIWRALGGSTVGALPLAGHHHVRWLDADGIRVAEVWTRLTASIDASLALVEKVLPVWDYSVEREASDYFSACLMKPGAPQVVSAPGKTGALAILAALLRAKIAEESKTK